MIIIEMDKHAPDDDGGYMVVEPIVDPAQGLVGDSFIAEFTHKRHAELFVAIMNEFSKVNNEPTAVSQP